jgi:seryl-tRNA synthetase
MAKSKNIEYDLESDIVGETALPTRCPTMEDIPVEAYADHIIDTGESEMTVKLIQKTKAKAKTEVKEKSALDIKVERFIDLKVQLDSVKAAADEYEKLRKELSGVCDEIAPADEVVAFTVENGSVQFTAKNSERKISDMQKVFDLLGKDTFVKVCKITMTDLDKYLGKGEQDTCIVAGLTGARKVSVIAKASEAKTS